MAVGIGALTVAVAVGIGALTVAAGVFAAMAPVDVGADSFGVAEADATTTIFVGEGVFADGGATTT